MTLKKIRKNKYFKYIFSVIVFLMVVFLTFYFIFYNSNVNDIINNLKKMKLEYTFVCLLLIFIYYFFQGIYFNRNMKLLNQKVSIVSGIYYSMVEFFFSGITPSSSGGQPVQLYCMNKDRIPTRKSLVSLLINTIYFKLIIVIFGIFILIFSNNVVFSMSFLFILFFFIGFIFDLFIVIFGYLLLYKQVVIKKILKLVEKILNIFKKDYSFDFEGKFNSYKQVVKYLKNNKFELFVEFIITFIQRLCLFSIAFVVYKSFGLNQYNYFQLLIIYVSVQTAIEFIPLPGGTGVSEYFINIFYLTVFGSVISSTAMLVTRLFVFYIPMLICLFVLIMNYVNVKIKKLRKDK